MADTPKLDLAIHRVQTARREKIFWTVVCLPLTALVVVLPPQVSLAIVTFLSIYALVISARGVERGGEAEVAGREPDEGPGHGAE